MAAVLNIIVYYWMTTTHPFYHLSLKIEENKQHKVYNALWGSKYKKAGLTIIILEFEDFSNNVAETTTHIHEIFPEVSILVVSDERIYPPLNLPLYVQQVILHSEVYQNHNISIVENYVSTQHVMIWPDGVRLTKSSDASLILNAMFKMSGHESRIVVWPADHQSNVDCLRSTLDVKHWTLKYHLAITDRCESIKTEPTKNVVVLIYSEDFFRLPYPMWLPIKEALFVQTTLRGWIVDIHKTKPFTQLKILDEEEKWKQNIKNDYRLKKMYKTFGVKLVQRSYESLSDSWYGCSKSTPRCFPTIIHDTPDYIHTGRLTPPCCMKNLATTTLHVIKTLETQGVRYWLEGGSLLGAVRSGSIIPWDYDVDIGIYKEDLLKCTQLIRASSESYQDAQGFVWERSHEDEGHYYRVQFSMTNHLHVDIFPFYSNNNIMTKDTWGSHKQDVEFPEHYLKPMEKMMFLGRTMSVPNHAKEFLELKFGVGVIENPQFPNGTKL